MRSRAVSAAAIAHRWRAALARPRGWPPGLQPRRALGRVLI